MILHSGKLDLFCGRVDLTNYGIYGALDSGMTTTTNLIGYPTYSTNKHSIAFIYIPGIGNVGVEWREVSHDLKM